MIKCNVTACYGEAQWSTVGFCQGCWDMLPQPIQHEALAGRNKGFQEEARAVAKAKTALVARAKVGS